MSAGKLEQYESGEIIFREGEPGDKMYILVLGAVELKKKLDKSEALIKTISEPNDFFGEMALIDGKPRSATAITIKRSNILIVDRAAFEAMILSNGKFALKIIKVLTERIRCSNDQLSELMEISPKERIARAMTDFALMYGEVIHTGGIKIDLEAMRTWINSRMGIKAEEMDAVITKLLKQESIVWAATSVKTHEHLVLPNAFIESNNRRGSR